MLTNHIYVNYNINVFTQDGLATVNEMCVSYLYYYPRHNLTICHTNTPERQLIEVVDEIEFV